MSVRKATVAVFASTIARNLLSFVAITYFSRTVGIATLGVYFLFQSVLTMLVIPADLGVRVGVEKRLSDREDPGSILASAFVVKIGLFAVVSGAILLLRGWLAEYIGADVAVLLVIALLLNELGRLGDRTLRGEQRVSETAIFSPLRTGVWAILGGVLVWLGFGKWALLYSYTAGLLAVVIIALWRVDTPIGRPTIEHTRSLIGYSKFAAIGNIGGLIYNWADVILLGFFLTQTAVGAYEVAWRVATASLMLSTAIRTSIFPQANTWGADDEFGRIEALIERAFIPSLYLIIPSVVGGVVLGDQILAVIFHVQYPMIHVVLVLLLLEKLQRGVVMVLIAPLHAVGRVDIAAYTTLAGVVTNIILNILLIPRFGVVGAAVGTTLGATVNTATHTWALSNRIDINVPIQSLGWCCLAALVMGGVLVGLLSVFRNQSLPVVIALVSIGGAIYVALTTLSPTIRNEVVSNVRTMVG
jgi:O-antigen/teichoic acid export membrane protein